MEDLANWCKTCAGYTESKKYRHCKDCRDKGYADE